MDTIAPKKLKLESLLEDKFPWRQSTNNQSTIDSDTSSRKSPSTSPPPESHPTLTSLLSAPSKAFSPGRPVATRVPKNEESIAFFAQCTTCRVYIPDQEAFVQHVLLHYPNQFRLINGKNGKRAKSVRSSPSSSVSATSPRLENLTKSKATPISASTTNIDCPPSTSASNGTNSVLRSLLSNRNASTSGISGIINRGAVLTSNKNEKDICDTCGEVFENKQDLSIHQKRHQSQSISAFTQDILKQVALKIEEDLPLEEEKLNTVPFSALDDSSITEKNLNDLFEIYRSCKQDFNKSAMKTPKVEL
ncbi:unnamed protein product, partial [Mesorhabditis belari]|uniref:C2H2-type domain-containing protein n=1 Tax=Mesorhabditis belari TaxID=2138241 RepID=A0AAF3FKT4_9BILA